MELFNRLLHWTGSSSASVNQGTVLKGMMEQAAEQAPHRSPADTFIFQQCHWFPEQLLKALMQKTLSIMKKDFCALVRARCRVRSSRSQSHLSHCLDNRSATFPLNASVSFIFSERLHSLIAWMCSPKRTSLLLTSSSFPHGLYFADELHLSN